MTRTHTMPGLGALGTANRCRTLLGLPPITISRARRVGILLGMGARTDVLDAGPFVFTTARAMMDESDWTIGERILGPMSADQRSDFIGGWRNGWLWKDRLLHSPTQEQEHVLVLTRKAPPMTNREQ